MLVAVARTPSDTRTVDASYRRARCDQMPHIFCRNFDITTIIVSGVTRFFGQGVLSMWSRSQEYVLREGGKKQSIKGAQIERPKASKGASRSQPSVGSGEGHRLSQWGPGPNPGQKSFGAY